MFLSFLLLRYSFFGRTPHECISCFMKQHTPSKPTQKEHSYLAHTSLLNVQTMERSNFWLEDFKFLTELQKTEFYQSTWWLPPFLFVECILLIIQSENHKHTHFDFKRGISPILLLFYRQQYSLCNYLPVTIHNCLVKEMSGNFFKLVTHKKLLYYCFKLIKN